MQHFICEVTDNNHIDSNLNDNYAFDHTSKSEHLRERHAKKSSDRNARLDLHCTAIRCKRRNVI